MGQSSPGSQTVTNKTEIDPTTQQWRNAIFGAGTNLYNQGAPEYYPGSTVTPYADQTWQGLDMLQANAQQGAVGLPQAYNAMGRAMSGSVPGMGTAMQASYGGMQNPWMGAEVAPQIANRIQLNSGANPFVGQIAQAGQSPTTMGVDALESFAGAQNPYLDQLYQQGAERVRNDVNAAFSTAGRTGANAAHTGAMTEGLGDLYANIYAPAYENAQNRRMSAAGQLAGIDQADRAAMMQGYGAAGNLAESGYGRGLTAADLYGGYLGSDIGRNAGLAESGFDRRLTGANLAGDLWSTGNADAARAAAMLPGLYQYGNMPGESMVGVGGAYETLADQYLQDDIARYNYGQNANWDMLQRYSNLMTGMPDFSGTTSTSTGQASKNRAMGALGGAASGASIGSMFMPGIGTGIGAGIGGLLGLFG